MESEEDMLYYSHQKLSNLIEQKGDKNAAIKDYLQNLNYQPIQDFATGLEWFNVSEPLFFSKHLKGKIVVLDFFTYCCINCMHIIPDLRQIEEEFPVEDGLVVIGVHSAKFDNEKNSQNILAAVQRYNITHPVVNDHNSDMWKKCDVQCWPTLLILGPNANPILMLMGEGHKENLQTYIKASLEFYKSKNQISKHKLPFKSAYHLLPDLKGPLLFPGKIAYFRTESKEEMLGISDTGNHRILIIKPDGTILGQIGGAKIGFKDGPLSEALFNSPQGLVFKDKSTIFVADTENHAIRCIDLEKKVVTTVAGTGNQGYDKVGGKQWCQQEISSPWDLCVFETPDMDMTFYPDGNRPIRNVIIIAMAGTHQIWALFLDDTVWWKCKYVAGTCVCIAGSGREENRNNSYPRTAAFAQPSGLALCKKNKEIYIADSESSSIRRLSLVDGKVTPVVGGDRNPQNLFSFGDKDGILFEAKLQHSLGLAISRDEQTLFIADTYNHKLKKVDISQNTIKTLLPPTGHATDGSSLTFNEPSGLCVNASGDKIYLADTNNHVIKVLNLKRDCTISSINRLNLNLSQLDNKHKQFEGEIITVKNGVDIGINGGKLIFQFKFKYENGLKLTTDAPHKWEVNLPDVWSAVPSSGCDLNNVDVVINTPENGSGSAQIDFGFKIIVCVKETCLPKNFIIRCPIKFKNTSVTSVLKEIGVAISPNNIKLF